MNRKGQTVLISVIIGIFIYLFGILFIDFVEIEANDALRSNTSLFTEPVTGHSGGPGLDCGPSASPNLNVSDGTKLTCLATDAAVPYFILAIIATAGGVIIGRLLR